MEFPLQTRWGISNKELQNICFCKKRMYKELVRLINVFSQDFEEDKLEFCENEIEVIISYINGNEEKCY